MTKQRTEVDDLLTFVKSEHCNLKFEGTAHLDGKSGPSEERFETHPLQRLIDPTPGGAAIRKALSLKDFSEHEFTNILSAAAEKFLRGMKGKIEIQFRGEALREDFYNEELPVLVQNSSIATVNNLPHEQLLSIYRRDLGEAKALALPTILSSMRDQKIHPLPDGGELGIQPREKALLDREVRALFGPKLREFSTQIRAAERESIQTSLTWTARTNEQAALGWRKHLPVTLVRLFLEKESKRRTLRDKRSGLDNLISENQAFEASLLSGRYNTQIAGAMLKHGVDIKNLYGPSLNKTINESVQKVITEEKARFVLSSNITDATFAPRRRLKL